jgi:DegV family protein with EDD domain
MQIEYLDGKRFYRGLLAGGKAIIKNQKYLNRINVFPVADADTGLNLAQTMHSILSGSRIGASLKETLASVADNALSGARGNSGIIFAQYLHGLSRELPEGLLSVKHFAESAQRAVKHLYSSLLNPVEGTMLTVIREWADHLVEQSGKTPDFLHAITASLQAARKSLQETPAKLKVLADAGVVDAGASGFVLFLEGVVEFIQRGSIREMSVPMPAPEEIGQALEHHEAPGQYRYCSEAILSGCSRPLDELKSSLAGRGDSLILAGGTDKLHIHLHTNDPDELFDLLFSLGEVRGAKVDDMLRQYQLSHERKFPVGIVTDTACDLPRELLDRYQIAQIPFGINFGNRYYLDKLTIQPDRFYRLLKTDSFHPASSQPTPATVKSTLDFVTGNYEKVIAVHISDKLSGIYQAASSYAATSEHSRLGVVNSRHLSVTEGLVTLRVARAVEAGMDYDAILAKVEGWIDTTTIYTDINTLRYMVRGGRVKPLTGLVAALLNLKPIVSLDREGKALALGKSFSRRSNMRKIVGLIEAELKEKKLWEYAIVHADAWNRAEKYAERLTKLTGKPPAYIMPLSPVVGVHNGNGAVGIGVSYDPV